MGQIRILSVDHLRSELIGENISKICGSKSGRWHSDDRLHCAHWVSHVLRWNNASSWPKCDDKAFGAVRGVQAIAGSCKNWQKFEPGKRPDRNACLVYVAPKGKFAYNLGESFNIRFA